MEQLGPGGPNPCGDNVKKTNTHFLSHIRVDVGSIATVERIAQLAEHVFVTERSVAQFPGGVISPTHCSGSLKLQTTTNPYIHVCHHFRKSVLISLNKNLRAAPGGGSASSCTGQ